MSNLTLIFSGKKGSGKNTAANFTTGYFLNKFYPEMFPSFDINSDGSLLLENPNRIDCLESYGVKTFSYADSLKEFCKNVLGLTHKQTWGTQADKETLTDLMWDNLPKEIRDKYDEAPVGYIPTTTGPMTGREVMQVFGTDIIRAWDNDAWVRATMNNIDAWTSCEAGLNKLALICDARFPNEIEAAKTRPNCKTIRLLRNPYGDSDQHPSETALDDYPYENYTLIIDNRDMDIKAQNFALKGYLNQWFKEME
jgi:hypothetical protein